MYPQGRRPQSPCFRRTLRAPAAGGPTHLAVGVRLRCVRDGVEALPGGGDGVVVGVVEVVVGQGVGVQGQLGHTQPPKGVQRTLLAVLPSAVQPDAAQALLMGRAREELG